jgi:uncharacterized protein
MIIWERDIGKELREMSGKYPVITLTGPRQSGKTTLVKNEFPDLPYYNLENPETRHIVMQDPLSFINRQSKGVIIDEFQRYPELPSYIQVISDERKQNGQFILTGSNHLSMLSNLSQSLAGRTALLKLLPFSINEITGHEKDLSIENLLYKGFYPGIYSNNLHPTKAYSNYFETYIERDLRQLSNIQNLNQFQLFVKLCAGRTGQLFNASSISSELGVATNTIKSWISILQATFIIFLLQPWHENLNKRLVKTPKLYFYDVGLASYLLGIENSAQLQTHPLRGNLFENMVVVELVKSRFNNGLGNNLYFYRDNHNNEVDIVQEEGYQINLFEIKSGTTFHPEFLKGLNYLKKLIPGRINHSCLVYSGKEETMIQNHQLINYQHLL